VKFYNNRGTCEQWIKEGKYALNWTRLICQGFEENEIRLKLFIIAYNLADRSWSTEEYFQNTGITGRDKGLVIEDDTVKTNKNRWQIDKACSLLLYASGRGVYKRMDMAWYYE